MWFSNNGKLILVQYEPLSHVTVNNVVAMLLSLLYTDCAFLILLFLKYTKIKNHVHIVFFLLCTFFFYPGTSPL